MTNEERLALATQAYHAKAEARYYVLAWRGGGSSQIYRGVEGFNKLTTLLQVTGSTLQNYFSAKKNIHTVQRTNPTTGETDIATITRINPPAKEKRPRGRPRTRPQTEQEYNETIGIVLAPPAKSVSKRTNRRT